MFLKKVFNRLFASERLLLYRHASDTVQLSPVKIIKANENNIRDVLFFDSPEKMDKYLGFLAHGYVGYLAYLGSDCVHRSWVQCLPGRVWLHWSLPMTLQENEAYIHFCETASIARGKNIFSLVLCQICEDFRHFKNIYICVNDRNHSSIRSVEKAGFIPVKTYRIVAIFNRLIYKKIYG